MKQAICIVALLGLFCSCSKQTYKAHTARTTGIPAQTESLMNLSDLEVSETKARGTATGKRLSKKQKEQNAIAEALKQTASDILVEPRFTYTYDKKGRLQSVEVSGYPARFRKFRTVTEEDAKLINSLKYPGPKQQLVSVPVVVETK